MEKTNFILSVEGQSTKVVLAQTCKGVFFIRSVSDTIFALRFLLKPLADHSLINTGVLVSFALIHQKGTLFKSLIELNTFL
jgi:hypothetical protein